MTTPKPVVMLSMLSRQRHCSRQLDFVAMLLRLHDNIDNRSEGLDNTRPTLSTIRDNAPICKVRVRMRCDTAFTGCTVLPVTGVDEMTTTLTSLRSIQSGDTRYAVLETDQMLVQFMMNEGETASQAVERHIAELEQKASVLGMRAQRIRDGLAKV
jgi:predicted aspartyl protease